MTPASPTPQDASKRAVVLLSGGLDSATCLALARDARFDCYCLSFRYGQRHAVELEAAANIAAQLGAIEHKVVDIDLRAFGGSALTDDIDVPKDSTPSAESIPVTYVPARNTIFLSFALAYAEVIHSSDIYIGVNAVDYSGYPDCRPEYIRSFQNLANLATRAGVEAHHNDTTALTLHTPLIDLTKPQIIQHGLDLGVDYGLTRSCYDPSPDGAACGRCESCQLRRAAFHALSREDPAPYQQ